MREVITAALDDPRADAVGYGGLPAVNDDVRIRPLTRFDAR
jgi:hypothetical protein